MNEDGVTVNRPIRKDELELESIDQLTGQRLNTTSNCGESNDEVYFDCLFKNMNPYKTYRIRENIKNYYAISEAQKNELYSLDRFKNYYYGDESYAVTRFGETISVEFIPDKWSPSEKLNHRSFLNRKADRFEVQLNGLEPSLVGENGMPFKLVSNRQEVAYPMEIKEDKLIFDYLPIGEYELIYYLPEDSEHVSFIKPHKITVSETTGYVSVPSLEPIEFSKERLVKLGEIETHSGYKAMSFDDIAGIQSKDLNFPDVADKKHATNPVINIVDGRLLFNGFLKDRYLITIELKDKESYENPVYEFEVDIQNLENVDDLKFQMKLKRTKHEVKIPLVGDEAFTQWIQNNALDFELLKDGEVVNFDNDLEISAAVEHGEIRLNKLLAGKYELRLKDVNGKFHAELNSVPIVHVSHTGEVEWVKDKISIHTKQTVSPEEPEIEVVEPKIEVVGPVIGGPIEENKKIETDSENKKIGIGVTIDKEEKAIDEKTEREHKSIEEATNTQKPKENLDVNESKGDRMYEESGLSNEDSNHVEIAVTNNDEGQQTDSQIENEKESLPMTGISNKSLLTGFLLAGIGSASLLIHALQKLKKRSVSMK